MSTRSQNHSRRNIGFVEFSSHASSSHLQTSIRACSSIIFDGRGRGSIGLAARDVGATSAFRRAADSTTRTDDASVHNGFGPHSMLFVLCRVAIFFISEDASRQSHRATRIDALEWNARTFRARLSKRGSTLRVMQGPVSPTKGCRRIPAERSPRRAVI